MNKAAIYTRKSKFTSGGESIENQINLCKQYARDMLSINDFQVYEDEGFSGGSTDRPGFRKMLSDSGKGKFNVILCYRIDRISRNVADFSRLIMDLENLNVSFISIREQFDTSTPMGRAMMNIAAVFAQLERETIAERIRDNMLELSKSGRWLGGVTPTGFKSKEEFYTDEAGVKRKLYKLVQVESELRKVKDIFNRFLETKSLGDVLEYLKENKIHTKNNLPFSRGSIQRILANPVYAIGDRALYNYFKYNKMFIASPPEEFNGSHGVLSYNKFNEKKGRRHIVKPSSEWIIAIGSHQGIIPSADWILVQKLLSDIKGPPRLGTGNIGLLPNILFCSFCGSPMTVTAKYKDNDIVSYYYRCSKKYKTKGKSCSCSNINGKAADDLIIDMIKEIKVTRETALKYLKGLKNSEYFIDSNIEYAATQITRLNDDMGNMDIKFLRIITGYVVKKILWDGETLIVHLRDD